MFTRSTVTGLVGFLGAALLGAGCREPLAPATHDPGPTAVATSGTIASATSGIILDQQNSTLNESGRRFVKGFNPTNPRNGDAIVATFVWVGSTNIITAVTDHLTNTDWTPVGNTYQLVEYVTAGGISMATYVPSPMRPRTTCSRSKRCCRIQRWTGESGFPRGAAWRGPRRWAHTAPARARARRRRRPIRDP